MNTSGFVHRFSRTAAVVAVALSLTLHALPASADDTAAPAATPASKIDQQGRYVVPFYVLDGKPDFDPGQGLGYWVWHDQDGLHLRTTTHGMEHDFNGVIRTSENSKFGAVDRVKLDHKGSNEDRVEVSDDHETIRFHFDTFDGQDGIDFGLNGKSFCMELENNSHEATDATHLGVGQLEPYKLPICFHREGNRDSR